MKKKHRVFLLILLIIITYFGYKYYSFSKYISIYNSEVIALIEEIELYSNIRLENIPNNEKDFNEMLRSLEDSKNVKSILNYGLSFKFNELDKSLSVYSFGVDKTDNNLDKQAFHSASSNEYATLGVREYIKNWSFNDFLFTNGKDVLLFEVYLDQDFLCRNFADSEIYSGDELLIPYSQSHVFIQGNKRVSKELKKELQEKIRPYKNLISPLNQKLNDSSKIFFVRFKDQKFTSVCSDNLNLEVFDDNLKDLFNKNNVDYAVIPIIVND